MGRLADDLGQIVRREWENRQGKGSVVECYDWTRHHFGRVATCGYACTKLPKERNVEHTLPVLSLY